MAKEGVLAGDSSPRPAEFPICEYFGYKIERSANQKALLIWPWLVVGTLVGTALLITLPIGAAIWWITLFLSRSSARLEVS
jgi:hypothetical protein